MKNKLRIFRTNSLSYNYSHKAVNLDTNQYFLSYLDWNKVDILISTPTQLDIMMKVQKSSTLDPKFVILDEFDTMLTDKKYTEGVNNTLNLLSAQNKKRTDRKYLLSGASMLKTIYGKPATKYLDQYFPDLNIVKSDRFSKINPKIVMENFDITKIKPDEKFPLVKQLMDKERRVKTLIFCNSVEEAEELIKYLQSQDIPAGVFHSKQDDSTRSDQLYRFETGKLVCMVSTDLGCRGIDFKDVKLVIQYDYAENGISLIHRIGRTGRFGGDGKVVSFVDNKSSDLFHEFTERLKQDRTMDDIFSRNRSFSKGMKKKHEEIATSKEAQ